MLRLAWRGLLPPACVVAILPVPHHLHFQQQLQALAAAEQGPHVAGTKSRGVVAAELEAWDLASLVQDDSLREPDRPLQEPGGPWPGFALLQHAPVLDAKFRQVFVQSFLVVAVAELFDKTWFVALLCSLYHGVSVSFLGSFLALALHTVLAACLGAFISRFFVVWLLHLVTAGVFFLFAGFYTYECYQADPSVDALRGRTEDAKEALVGSDGDEPSGTERSKAGSKLFAVFFAVFVAEWGDRTQVSMISLHSSMPVLPVCLGSMVAFLALCASAALVAKLLEGRRLSERLISGVSAASFLTFACLALVAGLNARHARQAASA